MLLALILDSLTLPGKMVAGYLIVSTVVSVAALVDIFTSKFRGSNDKLIWSALVFFGSLMGAILYFLIGRNQKIK